MPGDRSLQIEPRARFPAGAQAQALLCYWARPASEVLRALDSRREGLSSEAAANRLATVGPNEVRAQRDLSRSRVLWNQLKSPLLLLLVFAAAVSAVTGEWVDSVIVLSILAASVLVGYFREYRANFAAARLRERIQARATVLRDGRACVVPLREVVPGDVALLSAGSLVPADAVLLEANDLFVNEAVLTGESFAVAKQVGVSAAAAPLAHRAGCLYLGANVRSGTATCVIVNTGAQTEFGAVAERLRLRPPETDFDRGIRQFGTLLTSAVLVIVVCVFSVNALLGRDPGETLLFSIALAVGLSPELLPAILSVNLARGARLMAEHGVLVRRLSSIENLGSMNMLCTDKTGTLTEGVVKLDRAYDAHGQESEEVLRLAAVNARLQTGLANPLDEAILAAAPAQGLDIDKVAEIPYDFVRKRLSVVVRQGERVELITKGAFENILDVCTHLRDGAPLDEHARGALRDRVSAWASQGLRVLAVASGELRAGSAFTRQDECALRFAGFLVFLDRPKEGVRQAIQALAERGVRVKLISGDAQPVVRYVASLVGIDATRVLTGKELDELHDEALWHAAEKIDVYAEVDPNQKERIILSLKKMGHVVGYLGDGVNDAPAMHAADVSVSVETAVDVAREAADLVLLERDLDVLRRGIEAGRRTFANTLKYILMTTSANFGNMASMAVASLFLPFLPLLPTQVLLNNFLSDIPAIGLADDAVDRELMQRPRRWNMRFIGTFMLELGLLSSIFDFLAFAALLTLFAANVELFRTGWFLESLVTELAIALVVRTQRPFFLSRPAPLLVALSVAVAIVALWLPYSPFARLLGFVALPFNVLATMLGITLVYVIAAEALKRRFYRRAER